MIDFAAIAAGTLASALFLLFVALLGDWRRTVKYWRLRIKQMTDDEKTDAAMAAAFTIVYAVMLVGLA